MSQTRSPRVRSQRIFSVISREWSFTCVLVIGVCVAQTPVLGGETDPYTNRVIDVDDSLEALDEKVNEALDRISSNWTSGCNERAFIFAVYRDLGGFHWVDKIERWAMFAPEIDRLPIKRSESVYADIPILASSGARIGNFTRTLNVAGYYISTDKLGHFFSQGRKFYERYKRLGTVAKAARRTAMWESFIWGQLLSGIYSNADLVANYEGFLFYRGLFHSDVVNNQSAIFQCEDGSLVKQREFTWADHVNSLWDEMINPSDYRHALVPAIERRMLRLCSDYSERPWRYRAENVGDLREKYQAIAMRRSSVSSISQFLDENC